MWYYFAVFRWRRCALSGKRRSRRFMNGIFVREKHMLFDMPAGIQPPGRSPHR